MPESLKTLGALTLFVDDPQRSKTFYGGIFDAVPIFEDGDSVAVKFDNFVLNLPEARRGGGGSPRPRARRRRGRFVPVDRGSRGRRRGLCGA